MDSRRYCEYQRRIWDAWVGALIGAWGTPAVIYWAEWFLYSLDHSSRSCSIGVSYSSIIIHVTVAAHRLFFSHPNRCASRARFFRVPYAASRAGNPNTFQSASAVFVIHSTHHDDSSQIIFLPTRPRIRRKSPLSLTTMILLKRPATNLEASQRHSWTYFAKFKGLETSGNKNMMPDFDTVVHILESYYPAAHLMRPIPRRENVLQNLDYSLTKASGESFEDEMRVRLGDSASRRVRYIRAQDNIVQRE